MGLIDVVAAAVHRSAIENHKKLSCRFIVPVDNYSCMWDNSLLWYINYSNLLLLPLLFLNLNSTFKRASFAINKFIVLYLIWPKPLTIASFVRRSASLYFQIADAWASGSICLWARPLWPFSTLAQSHLGQKDLPD